VAGRRLVEDPRIRHIGLTISRRLALPDIQSSTSGRVSSEVVRRFEAMIASGAVRPGDRLPPERELAEKFGVGRGTVREALRELAMLGLVESRHGAGTYVRMAGSRELMAPFRSIVALSSAAVDDVVRFRRMFEPQVAAMAAERADEDDRQQLQRALRHYIAELGGPGAADADAGFHQTIAECTRNPIVLAVHHALAELFTDFRTHLIGSSYDAEHLAARGHQTIFGAIIAGDAEAARDAMAAHLAQVEAAIARAAAPR
jgi:GntR family transcriptional repressor for pyruvate dehydrogenase complex